MTERRDDGPIDIERAQDTERADEGGPLDDETPGSQGEIEAGSEGDFGAQDDPR